MKDSVNHAESPDIKILVRFVQSLILENLYFLNIPNIHSKYTDRRTGNIDCNDGACKWTQVYIWTFAGSSYKISEM